MIRRLFSSALTLLENKVARFVLIGGVNTAITLLVYAAIVTVSDSLSLAVLSSSVIGIAFSSFANSRYTFEQRSVLHVASFCAVYLITISANIALLHWFVSGIGIDRIVSQILLVVPIAACTFVLMRISTQLLARRKARSHWN